MIAIDQERLEGERQRLVRQCYRYTGNVDAAEDLAQETLYEAVRNAHKLHDPSGYGPWLNAIARNVCLRWNTRRGRDVQPLGDDWDPADAYDLEVDLDRRDLVMLLDRALALLPEESREVLIERFVRESPHAEVARKLGISPEAVMKRVERGKLRLKSVLSTALIHDAVAHGLAAHLFDDWESTDIWCPNCGLRRLLGKISHGQLWLICKPCNGLPVSLYATFSVPPSIRGYRAIHEIISVQHHATFARGITGLTWTCPRCRSDWPYHVGTEPSSGEHYVYPLCPRCDEHYWQFVSHFTLLACPEGRAFWHAHERVRILPEREIEAGGVPAIVAGMESVVGGHRLDAVLVRDTLELIAVG